MGISAEFAQLVIEKQPTDAQLNHAVLEVKQAFDDPKAVDWLRAYYIASGNYAGATFCALEPNDPHCVTATDFYAISLLNVKVEPRAARLLLATEMQGSLTQILHKIPIDADLATASEDVWVAADAFYRMIKGSLGKNPWVTASKLCARKRPQFFPVRDQVVTATRLKLGVDWLTDWQVYRYLMSTESIVNELRDLERQARPDGSSSELDPPLRILDVLLWMSSPKPRRRR